MLLQAAGVPAMATGGQTGNTGVPFNRALAKFKTLFNRAPNADEMAQIEAHAHKHVQGLRDGGTPSNLKAGLAKAKSYAVPAAMSLPIIYDMYDKIKSKDYPGLQESLLGLAGNYAFPHPLAMVFNPFEVHGAGEGENEALALRRKTNPYQVLDPTKFSDGIIPSLDARTHSVIPDRENRNDLSLAYNTNPASPTMLAKYKLDPYEGVTMGKNWEIPASLYHTQGTPFDQGALEKRIHSYIPGMSSFDNLD